MHRVVLDLFPRQGEEKVRCLYADKGFRHGNLHLLILSQREAVAGSWGRLNTRPVPEAWLEHDSYRFEIVINPVRRQNSTAAILPIRGRDEIAAWFSRHASAWGFAVQKMEINEIWADQFSKGGTRITLAKARITGILSVTDRDTFRQAFASGLGRGRAFGCGLLEIVPLRSCFHKL